MRTWWWCWRERWRRSRSGGGGPMWISNPAASPAFGPAAASLGGLLLAMLGALAVVERGRLRESVLLKRWATWALIAPIYVLGVLSGPGVALLFVSALSFQALR